MASTENGGEGEASSTGAPLLLAAARKSSSPSPSSSYYRRCLSHAGDELRSFRSCLRWMLVDQSEPARAAASWALFLLLGALVPAASHLALGGAQPPGRRAYDAAVQLSLAAAAALAYVCLSAFVRRYGLRRFLFLDKLRRESERVRLGYTAQLSRSFRLLACFVLPGFAGEVAIKLWWYWSALADGASWRPPFGGGAPSGSTATRIILGVACVLELASWLYRMAIFFLVCVLFRLICYLQILRMQDFAAAFEEGAEVAAVLKEHLRIRRQLQVISHRFRAFIVSCLVLVTASQFVTLLLTTRPHAKVDIFTTGDLLLCSIGLMTGLLVCLRSAAKITHKTQAITSHAATWHVCATVESFDADPEDPSLQAAAAAAAYPPTLNSSGDDSDEDDEGRDEDDLDDRKLMPSHVSTISFQKRQALVTYLENNKAGITVFGFVVDRTWLHALFMIEFSLVMWLLGKTVGIS